MNNRNHMKKVYILFLVCIFLAQSAFYVNAQQKKGSKEEINITSSFKPSIIKTGKIEFQPGVIAKDTSPYQFKYPFEVSRFSTTLSPFTVKPLALAQDIKTNAQENFAKIGFGNLRSPFASIAFSDIKENIEQTFGIDHLSAVGSLPDQKISQSSVLGSVKRKFSETQSLGFILGFNRQAFKLYGFDHSRYNLSAADLNQEFNVIRLGSSYRIVTGSEGQTTLAPDLNFDYVMGSGNTSEFSGKFQFPVSVNLSDRTRITAQFDADYSILNDTIKKRTDNYLLKLPVKLSYRKGKINFIGGIIPIVSKDDLLIAPDFTFLYAVNVEGLRFKAGIKNQFELNSLGRLFRINPFLRPPDSISLYSETDYYLGLDWVTTKALQFNFSTGISRFTNMPLFVNYGVTERQFNILYEPILHFFHIKAGAEYLIDENMKFGGEIKYYSRLKQEKYDHPYGFLPLELKAHFKWSPLAPLSLRFNASLWQGAMALPFTNSNPGVGQASFRLKDAADLNLGVDYKLNKKWALWVDLNNIANNRYQRWNRYESFGFNFLAGIRYQFKKQ